MLVRNGGKEGAHCGTSACAVVLSLLVTTKLWSVLFWLVLQGVLFPAYLPRGRMLDAGGTDSSWGPVTVALALRKALDPFLFTVQMQASVTTFVTRGGAGK